MAATAHSSDPERPSGTVLQEVRSRHYPTDVDPREALELQEIQTHEDNELNNSTPSNSSGDEYRVVTRRTTSRALAAHADARHRRQARKGAWGKLTRFWTHHVTLTVPHKSNRDYFGGCSPPIPIILAHVNCFIALERTFLAYIRTSLVITQQGVLIAQLFRLQAAEALADKLGFQQVGIPLSVTCHSVAILVALVGAYRFWRQQNAIARGKIHAGGWELNSVGILLGCVSSLWDVTGRFESVANLVQIILTTLIISIAITVEIGTDPSNLIKLILRG
ncbi:uncharacterized protein N7529_007050 [Penicillium soppii]|uniref:uncharacterized protein n=1 Tax=Penicillium soppii TaxID=69789 RepID=UPI002546BD39|nr:uncharacterized protein N7529_007050 [Penicillium soppii]KAJ5865134.1 hypothetical protein N7529_007050 [Penicillium soppii]